MTDDSARRREAAQTWADLAAKHNLVWYEECEEIDWIKEALDAAYQQGREDERRQWVTLVQGVVEAFDSEPKHSPTEPPTMTALRSALEGN